MIELKDGEAVLVWGEKGSYPVVGSYGHHPLRNPRPIVQLTCCDRGAFYRSVFADECALIVPLRLARLAGEMAEALESIAKEHASGGHFCRVCEGAGGRWPCETRAEAVAVLAKAGIEVPGEL